jgi:hypothetical protein
VFIHKKFNFILICGILYLIKIMPEVQSQNTLSTEQKAGFTLLLIFALLALSLGFLQIRNTLYSSFAMNEIVPFDIKDQVNTMDALRLRDTDQDGLTDFDELYLYNTSRYLEDTDSDGILDGAEVLRGSSPICAEGADCGADITQEVSSDSEVIVSAEKPSLTIAGIEAGDQLVDLRLIFNDPEKIRLLLIESGVSEEEINQLSDAELLEATKSYREMAEQGSNTQEQLEAIYNGVSNNSVSTNETIVEDTSTKDATAISDIATLRNTLIQNGIPADVLAQISDEQIVAYFEQSQ